MSNNIKFITWCDNYGLSVKINKEQFFLIGNVIFKPKYKINNYYVDLIDDKDNTSHYKRNCQNFSKSYGNLIVIPTEIINDLNYINIKDIEDKFKIKL